MENRRNWVTTARDWLRQSVHPAAKGPRIGLALGGGFARGMSHIGVLRVLDQNEIPISLIAGVSAGSIVAAAYASGTTPAEIESVARTMRFKDIARWTLSRFGFADSERMSAFLARLLKTDSFESMRIPLAVVASDLSAGKSAVFRGSGDVVQPIRASCAYPGLFAPVRYQGHHLVDGMVSMEVPAWPLRQMGATHVLSVALPTPEAFDVQNMFSVVSRCFQIMSTRTEREWRRYSTAVITPDVGNVGWDSFTSCSALIEAGERAALAALPEIRRWLKLDRAAGSKVAAPAPATA